MRKQFRNLAIVLGSIVLLGILAQASASTDKDSKKNDEHHSRLSKAAFWKHHKHQDKAAKPSPATPQKAHTQKAQAQKAQPKTAELKPASAKKTIATKKQNQAHAKKASKPAGKSAGKSAAVAKANSSKKSTNAQASSFK